MHSWWAWRSLFIIMQHGGQLWFPLACKEKELTSCSLLNTSALRCASMAPGKNPKRDPAPNSFQPLTIATWLAAAGLVEVLADPLASLGGAAAGADCIPSSSCRASRVRGRLRGAAELIFAQLSALRRAASRFWWSS